MTKQFAKLAAVLFSFLATPTGFVSAADDSAAVNKPLVQAATKGGTPEDVAKTAPPGAKKARKAELRWLPPKGSTHAEIKNFSFRGSYSGADGDQQWSCQCTCVPKKIEQHSEGRPQSAAKPSASDGGVETCTIPGGNDSICTCQCTPNVPQLWLWGRPGGN